MNPVWQRIVDAGIRAPSGDNAQPWEFELLGEVLRVRNDPALDTSAYNYSQQASRIAIGCCIENMQIAASHEGYELDLSFFPDPSDEHAICDCELKSGARPDSLFDAIANRTSNRKRYSKDALTSDRKRDLVSSISQFTSAEVRFAEGDAIPRIANAASINERIVLGNRMLHHFLFSHITWSDAEDESEPGFFVKTLELQGPQAAAFRVLRYWPLERILNTIGMPSLVANDNARLYEHSGAICALLVPFKTPHDHVQAGRAYQRLWLTATTLGLAFQPLAGISLLFQKIAAGNTDMLSPEDVSLVRNAYATFVDMFAAGSTPMPMLFRIGKAESPSARTRRYPPRIRDTRHS